MAKKPIIYNPKDGFLYRKYENGDLKTACYKHKTQSKYGKSVYYRLITFYEGSHGRTRMRAHRYIWEMHYGSIPEGKEIDHINRDSCDNRLSNLRVVDRTTNLHNRGISRANKTGFRGVFKRKGESKYGAKFSFRGKIFVKRFNSKVEAAKQYDLWAKEFHGEHACTNF